MKTTKTFPVEELKEKANQLLANKDVSEDFKAGVCTLLDYTLMQTNNYHGFNYLAWMHGGCEQWHKDNEPKDRTPYMGSPYNRFYF